MDFDRFEFERQIFSCWSIVDELQGSPSQEYLNALAVVYDHKFKNLFHHFELLLRKNESVKDS